MPIEATTLGLDIRFVVTSIATGSAERILERVSAHLEVKRNHPLTTRRYYKRVAY